LATEPLASVRAIAGSIRSFKRPAFAPRCAFQFFLAGTARIADPEAYFMFHQASLNSSARENIQRQQFSESETARFSQVVKAIETQASDDLFRNDIGIRAASARSGLPGCARKSRAAIPG
jgi:hypothetical protein